MNTLKISISFLKKIKSRGFHQTPTWLYDKSISDLTYRLPERSKTDPLIGFKELLRAFKRKKKQINPEIARHLLLVSTSNQKKIAIDYVLNNLGKADSILCVDREELRIPLTLEYLTFSLSVAFHCIWSKDRVNLALQIREILEWSSLLTIIKARKIKSFIDFTPFEKDSNLLATLLKNQSVSVIKIPSPGPLSAHHTHLISDGVVCSSAYHLEEIQNFKHWNYSKLYRWPAEQFHTYSHVYDNAEPATDKSIAFYSHGEWVRRVEGHADPGLGILENESFILKELNVFLSNYNDIRLVIYPHPKERKRTDMESYYAKLLPNCTYSIYAGEFPTAWNFHQEDLAILAYSTLLFERLALGFKTMFVSLQKNPFPIAESPINHICLRTKSDFHIKIKEAIGQNKLDYFEKNRLNSYVLSEFLLSKSIQD